MSTLQLEVDDHDLVIHIHQRTETQGTRTVFSYTSQVYLGGQKVFGISRFNLNLSDSQVPEIQVDLLNGVSKEAVTSDKIKETADRFVGLLCAEVKSPWGTSQWGKRRIA